MGKFRAYLALGRIGNLPTVWSNVLAAGLLGGTAFSLLPFLHMALALSCFYLAGMVLNDLRDVEIDRRQRPERPLPSGKVGQSEARFLYLALFVAGLAMLTTAPYRAGVAAGAVLVAAIVVYDTWHKGHPWSVLVMASCRLLVFAVVALALTGDLPDAALLGGGAQFFYITAMSLYARYEDHTNRSAMILLGRKRKASLMPWLLAGISLLDGVLLAILISPLWLLAGLVGAALTRMGQSWFRGD